MNYLKRSIFYNLGRYIVKFIIAIIIFILFILFESKFDFSQIKLVQNVHAVSPSTWYYAREMRLYPSLIMQGNSSLQNGNNTFVVDSYNNVIPYIQFDRITTSGTRLVFNSPVVEGSHTIHLDIYSCQAPSFKNTFKTGDSSSTGYLYEVDYIRHTTLSLANAQIAGTGSATLKNCRQDSYILNINSNGSGKYSSIDLNYDSSYSQWYILGYDYQFDGLSTSYFGGLKTDINNNTNNRVSNATNDIITTINSNRTLINNNTNDRVWTATSNINDTATSNTNQQISNANSNTQEMISNNNSNFNQLNSNLTDDSLETNTGNDFFDDSKFNDFSNTGILDFINLTINFLQSLIDDDTSCQAPSFPLPIVHNVVTLPCMSSIYHTHFPTFLSLYQLIVGGMIYYFCLVSIYRTIVYGISPMGHEINVLEL